MNINSENKINGKILVVSAWLPGGGIEKVLINFISNPQFKDTFILSLSTYKKYNWEEKISSNITFENCFDGSRKSMFQLIKGFFKSYNIIKKTILNNNYKYIFFLILSFSHYFFFLKRILKFIFGLKTLYSIKKISLGRN